jgi:hypothetical protein
LVVSLTRLARYHDAAAAASQMQSDAIAAADPAATARAIVLAFDVQSNFDPSVYRDMSPVRRAIEDLVGLGDDHGLAVAWGVYGVGEGARLQWGGARVAAERAIAAAERAGDIFTQRLAVRGVAMALVVGPVTVSRATHWLEAALAKDDSPGVRVGTVPALVALAYLSGRDDDAQRLSDAALADANELGLVVSASHNKLIWGMTSFAVGAFERSESVLLETLQIANRSGDTYTAPTSAALAAVARMRMPGDADVDDLLSIARKADESDIGGQAEWRWAWALDAARRHDLVTAERLAREAMVLLEPTEAPLHQAEAEIVLAEVLTAAGRSTEARPLLVRAMERFRKKGATAAVRRVERLLAQ